MLFNTSGLPHDFIAKEFDPGLDMLIHNCEVIALQLHIILVVSDQRSWIRRECHNKKQDDVSHDSAIEKQQYGRTTREKTHVFS